MRFTPANHYKPSKKSKNFSVNLGKSLVYFSNALALSLAVGGTQKNYEIILNFHKV